MKRIGIIFLVVMFAITLIFISGFTAFAGSKEQKVEKQQQQQQPTTEKGFSWQQFKGSTIVINFPVFMAFNKWIALIPEFEKKTGIKVEVDQMQYMRMHDKQLLELGKKPHGDYDVISIVGPLWKTEYAKAGYLTPLDSYIKNSKLTFPEYDFNDFNKALVTAQGKVCLDCKGTQIYLGGGSDSNTKLYAIPASSEISVFTYRKDLFKKYNLKVPDTWDDVEKIAKFFYENVPGVYGLTFRGASGHQAVHAFLNFADPFGAKMFGKNWEITFTNKEAIDVLYFMKRMVKYGPPGIPSFDAGANANTFLEGKAAMFFDFSRIAGMVRDPKQSKVVGKVGYAVTPKKKNRLSETGGFAVAIPANSNNKGAAWMFVTWMTSKEVEKKLAKEGVQLVDRVSILKDPELQSMFPEYKILAQQKLDSNWRPAIAELPEIENQYFGVAINQVLTGQKTPEEAMQGIVEPVKNILRDGGYIK